MRYSLLENAAQDFAQRLANSYRDRDITELSLCDLKFDVQTAYITGAQFVLLNQWVSVKRRVAKDKKVLVRVPATQFYSEYYAVAYWDGEDWIESQRNEVIHPSHWLEIPELNKEDSENE